MTVLFDHQAFCIQEYGGLSRYYTELIAGLRESEDITPVLPLLFSNNRHLQDAHLHSRPFFADKQFRSKGRLLYAINRWNDKVAIRTSSFDVFHATYYDPYFLPYLSVRKDKTPFVVTFLDMIHEKLGYQFPRLAQDKAIVRHKQLLAHRADRLIAVSESTKRDVVEFLNVDPAKIEVIYHGSSFDANATPQSEPDDIQEGERYLLFVGLRTGYKNFDWMLRSIHSLLKREGLRLVCAGGGGFTANEHALIASLGLTKLVQQQIATDAQLKMLYQNAFAFVFPSLYEGFGIPILEAFACRCPCILSNRSSLPEIGGDAALYINPTNSESLTAAVLRLLNDPSLAVSLRVDGSARANQFTWQKATEQTADLYRSLSKQAA